MNGCYIGREHTVKIVYITTQAWLHSRVSNYRYLLSYLINTLDTMTFSMYVSHLNNGMLLRPIWLNGYTPNPIFMVVLPEGFFLVTNIFLKIFRRLDGQQINHQIYLTLFLKIFLVLYKLLFSKERIKTFHCFKI